MTPQATDTSGEGAVLGRFSLDKRFHGDLDGVSKGEMLSAGTSVKDSAGYVAIERVSGELHGRTGTFALQHFGVMTRGAPSLTLTVVPDSGTGELTGLAGRMAILIEGGNHSYAFDYAINGTPFKPPGSNTVSPYLIVDGAARTIEFLVKAFDAVELRRFPGPNGRLMHAEVRIDDTVVMLADGAEAWPPVPSHVHVYVDDVDETWRRARAAGAVSVQDPVKKADPDKRGGVKDAGGTTWWIATKME
jgi:uncharacterized glyoxalase superfamily protein PhnB